MTYKLKDPYHKWKTFTAHVKIIKSYVNPNNRPDDHDYDPDQTPKQGETGEDQEMIRIVDQMSQRHDSSWLEKFYFVWFKSCKIQWVNEIEFKNFKITEDFIKSKK